MSNVSALLALLNEAPVVEHQPTEMPTTKEGVLSFVTISTETLERLASKAVTLADGLIRSSKTGGLKPQAGPAPAGKANADLIGVIQQLTTPNGAGSVSKTCSELAESLTRLVEVANAFINVTADQERSGKTFVGRLKSLVHGKSTAGRLSASADTLIDLAESIRVKEEALKQDREVGSCRLGELRTALQERRERIHLFGETLNVLEARRAESQQIRLDALDIETALNEARTAYADEYTRYVLDMHQVLLLINQQRVATQTLAALNRTQNVTMPALIASAQAAADSAMMGGILSGIAQIASSTSTVLTRVGDAVVENLEAGSAQAANTMVDLTTVIGSCSKMAQALERYQEQQSQASQKLIAEVRRNTPQLQDLHNRLAGQEVSPRADISLPGQ